MRRVVFLVWTGLTGFIWSHAAPPADVPRVIPCPQIEDYGEGSAILGARATVVEKGRGDAPIRVTKVSPWQLARSLRESGAGAVITGKRLAQAYTLEARGPADRRGGVRITAASDQGIYYALVSLCQLLDRDGGGNLLVPAVRLADWPEIGLRLAKTSASAVPLASLREFADWLPLYKLNVMGLQYHGTNSLHPEPFPQKVQALCARERQRDILETIVYFCPFRGQGYDFNRAADRQQYARFLQWLLDQGANGIEVDYNDWPGRGTPIEDVLRLACRAVAERNPRAYVLYCPPNRGASSYRGPASAEMTRVLARVPAKVWPLWTGYATLIEKPLEADYVREWTRAAGRRPFLWVNRVGPRDRRHNRPFSRPVSEVPGAFAFRGELLPKDLHELFEGVHFNIGSPDYSPSESQTEILAYEATAADYVWNPRRWEAVESCRRAGRFVEIMRPLVDE
jgi:hypothetical protein